MTIITRKIQIFVNEDDKETRKNYYDKLFKWLNICIKSANLLSSHFFIQDNIKNMVYLDENVKVKLANHQKDPDGILNTSYMNSGYRLMSHLFKGEIPMDILSNLNHNIQKTYTQEKTGYYKGDRSLRSYRNNIPIPFSSINVEFTIDIEKNVHFILYKIPFTLAFGRDRSGNRLMVDRIISGEYEMSNSALMYDKRKNKWFMLLTMSIPDSRLIPVKGKTVNAELDINIPIIAQCGKNKDEIGNKEEYLHTRLQIQQKLQNLQKSLRYANGGHGRKAKLQAIDRFHKKEKDYTTTKIHTYSRLLVNFAVKMRAEKIILTNQQQKEDEARESQFILRNWGYFGLKQMIEYKAKMAGIEVETEKSS